MTAPAPGTGRARWLDEFHAFSVSHGVTLCVLALIVAGAIAIGLRLRGSKQARMFDQVLAVAGAAVWLTVAVWWLSPVRFTWGNSLPLQLCDLAGLVAPIAIWTSWRTARSLLYFWGIGLCTQGLLTPLVREGPAHAAFWMSWMNHGAIALLAVYDLAVRGFRPQWRDLGRVLLITTGYALCMFALDAAFGWNYAYLGRGTPGATTILDALGPWPVRALLVMLLGALALTALMIPWQAYRWIRGGPPSARRGPGGD